MSSCARARRRFSSGYSRNAGQAIGRSEFQAIFLFIIDRFRGQLHKLQAAAAPIFNMDSDAPVLYGDIVDVLQQCVGCLCANHPQQHGHLRIFVVNCLAALLLRECEDMCAASAPLTLETAAALCTRIGLLRGRLMQSEGEGGVGLDVSVCLRSVAVAAVLTVAHAKHAKDFVAGSLPSSSAGSLTPIKHRPRDTPSVSNSAAEESTNSFFTGETSSTSLLNPPLPPPLTTACAKQLLAYRKDLRCCIFQAQTPLFPVVWSSPDGCPPLPGPLT